MTRHEMAVEAQHHAYEQQKAAEQARVRQRTYPAPGNREYGD